MHRCAEVHAVEGEEILERLLNPAAYQVEIFARICEYLSIDGYRSVNRFEEVDLYGNDLARFQILRDILFEKRRRRSAPSGATAMLTW